MGDSLFEFLGILFAVMSIITYFIGRHQGRKEILDLRENLRVDMVDTANTQSRVKDGGKVKIENGKIIGAHERAINEKTNVSENVVVVKKSSREITENVPVGDSVGVQVTRAKDRGLQED